VDRVWHTVTYLIFPFSGAVFMVDWLPPRAQQILLYLPMVHATEWIRHAYFGEGVRTYEDPLYVLAWDLVLLLVGLYMADRVRKRIEPE
jgi:capsular polysaccharide transport system permease protein